MYKNWFYCLAVTLLASCAYTIDSSQFASKSELDKRVPQASPTNLDIRIEQKERFNHDAKVLGITCSAFDFHVNLAKDLEERLVTVDRNGSLENPPSPDVTVTASSASTTLKCVATGVASGKCQAETRLVGSIVFQDGNSELFDITKKSIYSTSMQPPGQFGYPMSMCEGAAWAIYNADSETIDEIVEKIRFKDT
jgi:hypothetical protein